MSARIAAPAFSGTHFSPPNPYSEAEPFQRQERVLAHQEQSAFKKGLSWMLGGVGLAAVGIGGFILGHEQKQPLENLIQKNTEVVKKAASRSSKALYGILGLGAIHLLTHIDKIASGVKTGYEVGIPFLNPKNWPLIGHVLTGGTPP